MFRNIKEGVRVRQTQREADIVDLRREPVQIERQEAQGVPSSSTRRSQYGDMDGPRCVNLLLLEHGLLHQPAECRALRSSDEILTKGFTLDLRVRSKGTPLVIVIRVCWITSLSSGR